MVTCYDHWSAKILNKSNIDCLLVGDSLAVVMHGFDSTVHATIEMMALHVAAVVRGAPDKFIIADMPFLSCSKGLEPTMDAVQTLMQAGAHAIKIEGADHQAELIKHIVEAGSQGIQNHGQKRRLKKISHFPIFLFPCSDASASKPNPSPIARAN